MTGSSHGTAPEPFDPYHIWLGIPPRKQPPNHYCLLGIEPFEASPLVIEHAADQRTAHLRLCQSGPHGARSQELLNEVASARICLLRPEKKAAYDAELLRQLQEVHGDAGGGPGPADPRPLEELWKVTGGPQRRPRRRQVRMAILLSWLGLGSAAIAGVLLCQHPPMRQDLDESPARRQSTSPPAADRKPPPSSKKPAASPAAAGARAATAKRRKGPEKEEVQTRAHEGAAPRSLLVAAPPLAGVVEEAVTEEAVPHRRGTPWLEALLDSPSGGSTAADQPAKPTPPDKPPRLPVPPPDTEWKAIKALEEAYPAASVTSPEEKIRLARALVELSNERGETSGERFVLLRRAAELAGEAGDVPRMLGTVDALAADFELDALSVKTSLLRRLNDAVEGAQVPLLVRGAWQVIDQAVAAREYHAALEVAELAATACQRPECRELRRETENRLARVRMLDGQQKKIRQAEKTLGTNPENGQANLLLGRWHCFQEGDWPKGLRHLANSSDRDLRLLAERELDSPPTAPEEQLKLADAWWRVAQSRPNEEKDAMLLRAGHWYERCDPEWAEGLVKARIEKRLKEIARICRPTGGARGLWSNVP